MIKLSDTQLVLLSNAAKRDDGALLRPAKAHPPALANAIKQLLARALVRKTAAGARMPAWGDEEDGARYALCITPAGLDAIGVDDSAPRPPSPRDPKRRGRRASLQKKQNRTSRPRPLRNGASEQQKFRRAAVNPPALLHHQQRAECVRQRVKKLHRNWTGNIDPAASSRPWSPCCGPPKVPASLPS